MNAGLIGIMNIIGLGLAFVMPQSWLAILIILNIMMIFMWGLFKDKLNSAKE